MGPAYFVPDWDDLVDPGYDFASDTHSGGKPDWSNEVYAHQIFGAPNCDGILVSRAVAEKSRHVRKYALAEGRDIHHFLRVPDAFPVMGDCGAFSYVAEKDPPYRTDDLVAYYTRLGFTYGVSIDHLILSPDAPDRDHRYRLTLANAEAFLAEHRRCGLAGRWEPIAAVQGWDAASYAEAASACVRMGYGYVAVGGLVRKRTPEILRIAEHVRRAVPRARLHLFGVARPEALRRFHEIGVTSVDSASALRTAWLHEDKNYLTPGGWYAAIRVPDPRTSPRARQLIRLGVPAERLEQLSLDCMRGLHAYDQGTGPPGEALVDGLAEYAALLAAVTRERGLADAAFLEEQRRVARDRLRRTLEDRPWASCPCAVCRGIGIDVVVFRGNNRNRRRGFHNTYVFYRLIGRILAGESFAWLTSHGARSDDAEQLVMFPATP